MKTIALVVSLLLIVFSGSRQTSKVVQFNIGKILNARPVTTIVNRKMKTWTKGIDGNGAGDGYLTKSAAAFNGDQDAHALPDDPMITATENHPQIQLHYSNTDGHPMQAHAFNDEDELEFPVASGQYNAVYLALTSAEGASNIRIRLNYASDFVSHDFVVPDYWADIKAGDPDFCYLLHDLAKWGPHNNMTEKDHHNIDLLKIPANPNWKLKSISISKTKPGYLVLWAAAGVKAE